MWAALIAGASLTPSPIKPTEWPLSFSARTMRSFCAGVTVYSPLRNHTTPAAAIGIIGIGGLGQLGLQFAAKRGNEVTAASPGTLSPMKISASVSNR